MAVTRINNNQVTDASAGNIYTGINASTKVQEYSITAGKIANNLVYGSDLTVTGNLTVNGQTTTIDTVNTLIEDPLITLADGQTSGAPTVDIGTIGLRGSENSAVMVWKESLGSFVTALSNTTVSNTTVNISSYANLATGNLTANGTTSLVGNLVGAVNATSTITAGNLATVGTASASGNITGGNILSGGLGSFTGNVTAANFFGNISGNIDAGGANTQIQFNDADILAGSTGFTFDKTANLVTVGGNVNAQNFNGNVFGTSVSASGTVTAASTVGGVITGSSTSVTGTQTAASTVGGVITGSSTSVTGTQTAASTVGGVITGSSVSVTGNVDAVNLNGNVFGTTVSATGNINGGNIISGNAVIGNINVSGDITVNSLTANTYISAIGNVQAGNVLTGGSVTAASVVGGVITGTSTSVTGSQTAASTVGGVITGSSVSVTGNVTGGNLVSATVTNPTAMTVSTNSGNINIEPAGNVVLNNKYINGLQLTPVQDADAASKYYVDTIATTGITIHEAVFAATISNLAAATGGTITYAQPNGAANGIGATLTTTGTYTTIDTANVQTVGTRILVKDEANAVQNGVYVYSNATVITRSTDTDQYGADSAESFSINDYFFTTSGNVNAGTAFVVSAPPGVITFGTSNIEFGVFSQSQVYSANTSAGLSLTGTVFSAKVDNNTTAFDGLGNIIVKAGANLTTPNIGAATGTSLSVTGAVTAASTVGGVITGTSVSVTGGVDAASVAGGVITGTSTSVTGTQTAASTVGGVITGSSSSVTGAQTAASTVGGVITGSSVSVTGNVDATSFNGNVFGTTVSATGNITGGNLLTSGSGGAISGTGNITGGNILTAGNVSATGNVIAAWLIGNIQGNLTAAGANTEVLFNDSGIANATSGFTFDKTANLLTVGGNVSATNFNGNVFGTSVSASGTVTAASTVGGVITGSSTSVTGTQTAASTVGGVITGSSVSVTGDVSASNLSISGGNIDSSAAAITINGTSADVDFAVNGDTVANVFYVDAITGTASFGSATQTTNAIVAFNSTNSILAPVGNTAQRPATGVTGMVRFNTTNNNLELYDNSQWTAVGVPEFTVIADQQFNGNGVQVAFTLSSEQTTNSCIVSINGVVQIPTIAYSVSSTTLTFTEAPAVGDIIDVRQITTTTSVTSIANSSGNAVVAASETAAQINVTGDLSVAGSILGGNINSTAITFGTSNMSVVASGGNIRANIGGTTVQTISPGLVAITGDLSVTGNATLSGNILGDRIQNGTTSLDIQTASGNANINIGGTGNLAVFSPGALNMTGNIIPTANITYDLGTNTNRWKDIWLANSTIYLGNSQISANATSLILTNPQGGQTVLAGADTNITAATVSTTGNITGSFILGNGSQLTGIDATSIQNGTSSVSVIASGGNVRANIGGATVTTTYASGLAVTGLISATGTVTAASTVGGVITGSSTSVTGAVSGASASVSGGVTAASVAGGVITGSSSSVTGTTTAASVVGGVITGTSLSTSGNITGANLTTAGTATIGGFTISGNTIVSAGSTLTIDPNASGGVDGLVVIAGNLQVTGNTTIINSNVVSTNDLTINFANNAVNSSAANGAGIEAGPIGAPYLTFLYNNTSNVWTSSGGLSAVGNITGGNLSGTNIAGTLTTAAQTNITSVGTLSALSVTGNVQGGNIRTAGLISATGSITGASVVGGVITGSSVSVTGAQTAASTVGGVITGTSTSVTGAQTAASTVGGVITGSSTSVTGTTTAASVVGGVITGSSVSVTGAVSGASASVSGAVTAASTVGGVITGSSVSVTGTVIGASLTGTITTAAQTNITSVGTLSALSVTGNVQGGNLRTAGLISATGSVTAASVVGGVITGTSTSVTGAQTAASTVGGVITGSSTSVTGATTAASVVGGVMTGTSVSVSGTVTGGNVTTAGQLTVNSGGNAIAIINGSTDGIGNIGSSGDGFNTVFAKATSAQYADLAEKYTADAAYAPGTVVVFGGTHEVSVNAADSDRKVAGVVSTTPAYIMNDRLDSEFTATVALTGRVPTMVIGPVRKGDLMVAAGLGRARAEADPKVGTVIGKALEDFDGAEGTIEVVVGRF
jgi:hypothetical protein